MEKQRVMKLEEERKKNPSTERNKVGVSLFDDFSDYYDPNDILEQKIDLLVDLIKQSKTIVVYTGAGISTSAGISDYRSWNGVWTSRLLGFEQKRGKSMDELKPTLGHMALYQLVQKGIVQYVVSTNVDNLHRRSGLTRDHLAELHGNCYKEICSKCGLEYFRPKRITSYRGHKTGNICQDVKCKGELMDSIIHFGENLPESELKLASDWSKKADIALVLGSSMRVKPACWLTEYCYSFGNNGKIVICNLQKTEYESKSYLTIFNETDRVMVAVMKKLGLEIPPYNPQNDPTEKATPSTFGDIPKTVPLEPSEGFAVNVSTKCPHAEKKFNTNILNKMHSFPGTCSSCKSPQELWFCLSCGEISCGRHVNGHALSHYQSNQHPITISFEDLSCWCYDCDDYIDHKSLRPALFLLHQLKFGNPHPKSMQ